jgi:two-component SAPR family response regulator
MPKSGPIIIIEDDFDDQEMLKEVFEELKVPNILRFFNSCIDAIDYLLTTIESPFLIISDINLPSMTGIELKQQINNNVFLRKKSIPFVFLSTTPDNYAIATAYNVWVQGYFVKPSRFRELKEMMGCILTYWKFSRQPDL